MMRRPKHSKNEVAVPKEEKEFLYLVPKKSSLLSSLIKVC
jgi:hypothetical protein